MPTQTKANTSEKITKDIANEILADLIALFSKANYLPRAKQQAILKALRHPKTNLTDADIQTVYTFLYLAFNDTYSKDSKAKAAIDQKIEDLFNRLSTKPAPKKPMR